MPLKNVSREQAEGAVPRPPEHLTLDGLQGEVEIYRDVHGIPHIRALSTRDTFMAQGYVHALDRLWQMEFDRRRALGRWSEVVGSSGIVLDRFVRRAQIQASAQADVEAFSDQTREMVDAYTAGVNAFINTTDALPVEYEIAGIEPEPWEAWHCSAVFKIRHIFMGTALSKLLRARVLNQFGPEAAAYLRSEAYGDEVLIVPPGEGYEAALRDLSLLEPGAEAITRLSEFDSGSNNWAVHGSRTATGKPFVAGDPHRALDVPNVYYQNQLACPEFDVIGYSFGGVPGFPHFGHNANVAWCITHAGADYQDLFVEHFDPNQPGNYEYRREWRTVKHHTETITVRDAEPLEIDIHVTEHGPIVIGDPSTRAAIALRYSALLHPNSGFECLRPMLSAGSVAEFDEAMRHWVDPCNNLITGDVHGDIGYLTRGQLPVRSMANGWLPVPGWTGEHEWQGFVPFEELPRMRSPENGYIVTANNRIIGPEYPHYIALDFAPNSRALRIISHLKELETATIDDMQAIHADRISLPSRIFTGRLAALSPDSETAKRAQALVTDWDGGMERNSPGATIYAATRNALTRIVGGLPGFAALQDNPFASDEPPLAGPRALLNTMIPRLLANDDTALLPNGTSWDDLVAQAFGDAVSELTEAQGDDPDVWEWSKVHTTIPIHPLALADPALGATLNPPSVSIGGDGDTPQASSYVPGLSLRVMATSVARYIFDLSDWDNSRWIVPLGSSGHPGSPHFADQAERWSNVEYIPMLYSWERIESEGSKAQTLEPGS